MNPISSDLDVLRSSVFSNLIIYLKKNIDRGFKDISLFEIGPSFFGRKPGEQQTVIAAIRAGKIFRHNWIEKDRVIDVFDAKRDVIQSLTEIGFDQNKIIITDKAPSYYHPGKSGTVYLEEKNKKPIAYFGEMHPNILNNVDIVQFDEDFNFIQNISADKVNIKNKTWKSENILLNNEKESNQRVKDFQLSTNINFQDINSLFSNLNSLSIFELNDLKNKYNDIKYSSIEVDSAIQKIFSFPFYLMLMTILSSTIMMNIKQNRSKIFHLIFGILISVLIYYLSFFFEELGKNGQVPVLVSIWVPLLMIGIVSMLNLVRINEK